MMLQANIPIPLYKQLYHQLHRRIENGDYRIGEKLPSERELAADCGISRLTVRRAIELLEKDGCVRVQHGSGAFVICPEASNLPLVALIDAEGVTPEQQTICVETVAADEDLAKRLNIQTGADVTRVEQIRYAGDTPVSLDVSWSPSALAVDGASPTRTDAAGTAD